MALEPGVSPRHPTLRRVLLVGVDPAETRALLTAQPQPPALSSASSIAEARAHLAAEPIDVVVASHRLPDGQACELFDALDGVPLLLLAAPGQEASAALDFRESMVDVLVRDPAGGHLALLPWRIEVALRRVRDRSDAGRYQQDVLDSVADEIAVLDADGAIISVNRAWRKFSLENARHPPVDHVGMNYLAVCRRAAETAPDGEAAAVADGLAAVLAGDREHVEVEYPCDGPDGERWFTVSITRLAGPRPGAVVAHRDITERHRSEQALRRAKEILDRTGELARVGGWEVDLATMRLTWTRETFRIAEIDSLVEPSLEEGINLFAPEARPVIAAAVQAASATGTPYDLQLPIVTAKGRRRWVQTQGFAEHRHGRPVRIYGTFQDITERKAAEDALRASDQRLRDLVASTDGIVWEADAETFEFTSVSEYAERLLGYPVSDWFQPGFWASHIHPDDRESTVQYCVACTRRGEAHDFEYQFLARDGQVRWLRDIVRVVEEDGRPRWLRGLMVDITASKQAEREHAALEARLAQAQKLESIGRLAGGVAHDFNNMLAVILGHADLALRQAPPSHPLHQDLMAIQAAAQRSAALTRQMLAFARKQAVTPRVLVIDEAVAGTLSILERLLGEDIALAWKPGASWRVWMDPSQLDQILTNLCVNARDAIRGVGAVTVTTSDRTVREPEVLGTAPPGDYVVVSVSDSGQGMDEATMAHIFEPFFTTKPVGAGTGLGLAMVDGAVRQNGGFVTVTTRLGHGSTFDVFLPRYVGAVEPVAASLPAGEPRPAAPARILLVEDEPGILRLATQMLEGLGHVVLPAGSPTEAIALAQSQSEPIDLLLTDVIMPAMNGQELANAIRERWPHLEVLFMSGYTADVISQRGLLTGDTHFLQKPFLVQDLGRAVESALARDTAV